MIRWISESLGTGAYERVRPGPDDIIIDVRNLVDKSGNVPSEIWAKVQEARNALGCGKRVVICCDYGISRSNSVAVGVLSLELGVSFTQALRHVLETTNENEIKVETLNAVRRAVEEFSNACIKDSQRESDSVLLTGATGYLGGCLKNRLSRDFEVSAPDRKQLDLMNGPVSVDLALKEARAKCLVHCASPPNSGKNSSMGVNLTMLKNIVDACIENRVKIVLISSSEIFSGYDSNLLRADELTTPMPSGTPGETKLLCENLINFSKCGNHIESLIIRSCMVFGGAGNRPKFLFNFIDKAMAQKPISVHKYSNGHPIVDLLHIDDFCDAVSGFIKANATGVYHVGSGKIISTRDIAEKVCSITGSDARIKHSEIDAQWANVVLDNTKAIRDIGWKPRNCLDDFIKKTVKSLKASKRIA